MAASFCKNNKNVRNTNEGRLCTEQRLLIKVVSSSSSKEKTEKTTLSKSHHYLIRMRIIEELLECASESDAKCTK